MIRKLRELVILALLLPSGAPLSAQLITLSNGTGDGQVTIVTDALGNINPLSPGGAGTGGRDSGLFNPLGPDGPMKTIMVSELDYAIYQTRTGPHAPFARQSTALGPVILSQSGNATSSTTDFRLNASGAFYGTLVQSLSNLYDNGIQTGSLLEQNYTFRYDVSGPLHWTMNIVRYLDPDLLFGTSYNDDGGGVETAPNGSPLLYALASPGGDRATSVSMYNEGGMASGYQIGSHPSLFRSIRAGAALDNTVLNSGGDGVIDTGFEMHMALNTLLYFTPDSPVASFTTYTIFGYGSLTGGTVPEPATWAMMIGGFGAVGSALRRRRRRTTVSLA